VAAAFLAGLDEADAARPRDALGVERRDGAERGEDRIAVVGTAAAVEASLLDHRRPWPEAIAPAGHLGLLVEMAVERHGRIGLRGGGHVEEDQRRAALEGHHLELHAADLLA